VEKYNQQELLSGQARRNLPLSLKNGLVSEMSDLETPSLSQKDERDLFFGITHLESFWKRLEVGFLK
jgi:hypothetical protein